MNLELSITTISFFIGIPLDGKDKSRSAAAKRGPFDQTTGFPFGSGLEARWEKEKSPPVHHLGGQVSVGAWIPG
jgi:hypothetical protein